MRGRSVGVRKPRETGSRGGARAPRAGRLGVGWAGRTLAGHSSPAEEALPLEVPCAVCRRRRSVGDLELALVGRAGPALLQGGAGGGCVRYRTGRASRRTSGRVRRARSAGCLGNFCMPFAVGEERAARGESSAGLECDAERTARRERRGGGEARGRGRRGGSAGGGGAGGRGAPWRRLPSTRRVVAAEAVSGKSGGVKERHCQRAAAADKSRGGLGESYKEGGALFVTLQAAIQCRAV